MVKRLCVYGAAWCAFFLFGVAIAPMWACSGAVTSGLGSDLPVDLPVTIAKNQDGTNAASFLFNDTYFESHEATGSAPEVGDDEEVGILTGSILSPPGTLAIFAGGEVIETVEIGADGAFTYAFEGSLVGEIVSFSVYASDSSGGLSPPVNVTVAYDELAFEFKATVHLTDYSVSSADTDTAFDIQEVTPAVSAQDQIAFLGLDDADIVLLGVIDVSGGASTILNDALTGVFGFLEFDDDSAIYGADETTGVLYKTTSTGETTALGDETGVPTPRKIKIHPSGNYLAANVFTTNANTGGQTQTVAFLDLTGVRNQMELPLPISENQNATAISFDWTTNNHLVVFKAFGDGTYNFSEYDVSQILIGSLTLPAATFSVDSATLVADPDSDRGVAGNIAYLCQNGDVVSLCGYNRNTGSLGLLAEGDFDVTAADFSSDGSCVVFSVEAESADGTPIEETALYDFGADAMAFVGPGGNPRTVPSDRNLMAFVSPDVDGNLQLGLFQLEDLLSAAAANALAISPSSTTMAPEGLQAFTATGGQPPHAFSIAGTASGSIEASSGLYTAPSTTGTETVRVTDANGTTADAFVTIASNAPVPVADTPVADTPVTVASNNANLSNLFLSKGTLTPSFDAATTSYTASVNYLVPSLTLTATASDSGATIALGDGTALTSGVASSSITLSAGSNAITTNVTAPAGNTQSYVVATTREATTDFAQQAYAKGANTAVNSFHGWNIAIDGDTMVVGSYGGVNGGFATGAAYVYTRSGTTWTYRATLTASNADDNDYFGYAVTIAGDTIAVGAILEASAATGIDGNQADNSAATSGAAYVFTGSGASWTQQAYVKASNTGAGDFFGYSVGLAGDTLVVGAYGESSAATGVGGNQADNSAANAGAVYVYTRSGSTWSQQAYLKASNTEASDSFGSDVAISGDTIVVSAPTEASAATGVDGNQADNSAASAGAAYVFTRNGSTWSQQAYLKASNTNGGDAFGFSLDVSGDSIIVGARTEASAATGVGGDQTDNSKASAGAAYVFTRSGTIWSQQAYLKASNTDGGDTFGHNVAINGDIAVVGAPLEDSAATGVNGNQNDSSTEFTGAAYVFTRSGSTWTQPLYLKASNAEGGVAEGDEFGRAVEVAGDTVAVGAPHEDSSATGVDGVQADNSVSKAGAVYVFQ